MNADTKQGNQGEEADSESSLREFDWYQFLLGDVRGPVICSINWRGEEDRLQCNEGPGHIECWPQGSQGPAAPFLKFRVNPGFLKQDPLPTFVFP